MTSRSPVLQSLLSLLALTGGLASAHAQSPGEVEIEVESSPAKPPPVGPQYPGSSVYGAPKPGPTAQAAPPAIEVEADAPVASPPPAAAASAELSALKAELAALNARVAASEAAQRDEAAREASEDEEAEREREAAGLRDRIAKLGVTVSGYVQAQYGQSQLSQDELIQGGQPLNQDRFAVRRGRLRIKGRWKYLRTDFEVDASTTRGPTASVRRALIAGVLPSAQADALPLLVASVGLTEIPLGLELQQGQDEILFLERTAGSLALFPGPVDTGLRLDGAFGPFRAQVAVMNGIPLDDRAGGPSGIDPTRSPDVIGRVGIDTKPLDALRIAGGVSFLTGKGFHPGADATKSVLQWDDGNADGVINAGELVAVAGRGALPSESFHRWAVGADLDVDVKTRLGWTRVYGELLLATNLDRALFVADPVTQGDDIRELAWYVAAVQDVTQWGFVGIRYDVYDPNSDLVDSRRGKSIPADASIRTVSPIAGARWPGFGRITFEYDHIDDKLARDTRGVPTDVRNDQWIVRVQGEF
ncbi:MAG: hypothetical protein ABW252_24590 [Polyangiales bacterium]